VFDEIISFLINASESGVYGEIGGLEAAFDSAVLMKVLPKFHGSRGRLEKALLAVLAWCIDPDHPDLSSLEREIQQREDTGLHEMVERGFRYPKTADRVRRLLERLYLTGFAAFG